MTRIPSQCSLKMSGLPVSITMTSRQSKRQKETCPATSVFPGAQPKTHCYTDRQIAP